MELDVRTAELLDRIQSNDMTAVGALFGSHRERFRRTVAVRLDDHVPARLSPDDILQEAFLDGVRANRQVHC